MASKGERSHPAGAGTGPPPRPPADLGRRSLPIREIPVGTALYRIHLTRHAPVYFRREPDSARRRWDAPNTSYGVCYAAFESHISFVETLLRDLSLDTVHQADLNVRSLARLEVRRPLRLVEMSDQHLRSLSADASVVHASYDATWAWSAALHAHRERPDGIRYRARHDDSGFSAALFERAQRRVRRLDSIALSDPGMAAELAGWLGRYGVGLTT